MPEVDTQRLRELIAEAGLPRGAFETLARARSAEREIALALPALLDRLEAHDAAIEAAAAPLRQEIEVLNGEVRYANARADELEARLRVSRGIRDQLRTALARLQATVRTCERSKGQCDILTAGRCDRCNEWYSAVTAARKLLADQPGGDA